MAMIPVRVGYEVSRAFASTRPVNHFLCNAINGLNILTINAIRRYAERRSTSLDVARRYFCHLGVFVVEVIFADVNDGKFPDGSHVHGLVQKTLTKSAVTKETHGNASVAKPLR